MKHLVGRLSVSDNEAVFSLSAFVEVENSYVDTIFLMSIKKHSGAKESMKFNALELRALLHSFKLQAQDRNYRYTKKSGGSGSLCTLSTYSNSMYNYVGLKKSSEVQISFKEFEIIGLYQELTLLCANAANALYESQKHYDRKSKIAIKK